LLLHANESWKKSHNLCRKRLFKWGKKNGERDPVTLYAGFSHLCLF